MTVCRASLGENCKSELKALCGVWSPSWETLLCCTSGFPWSQPHFYFICIVLVTKYLLNSKCPILFTQRTSSSLWPCGPDLELTSDADLSAVGHPNPPGLLTISFFDFFEFSPSSVNSYKTRCPSWAQSNQCQRRAQTDSDAEDGQSLVFWVKTFMFNLFYYYSLSHFWSCGLTLWPVAPKAYELQIFCRFWEDICIPGCSPALTPPDGVRYYVWRNGALGLGRKVFKQPVTRSIFKLIPEDFFGL